MIAWTADSRLARACPGGASALTRAASGPLLAAAALCAGLFGPPARAATLDGVLMPDTLSYEGHELRLNGLTLRSYSIFHVKIYVAGLYLEVPTHDPAPLLAPRGIRVLVFHFVRDVDVGHVRDAWQEGFDDNCPKPCAVPRATMARFLDSVVAVRAGDQSVLAFDGSRMTATVNGRSMGSFDDAGLSSLLLACFFGPKPPTERMKHELLGLH